MSPEGAVETGDEISSMAKSWQGSGDYPGVDDWVDTTLSKGDYVYGGTPGQSNFYTTQEVMDIVGTDATQLYQGLQVGKGYYPEFRPGMTMYKVLDDIDVAYSKAFANPQFGPGGFDQYYINNFESVLQPIKSIIMTNK